MKILLLTQYYPPEIGAPQNRLHELAIRLKALGIEIDVLTAMPNYPMMEIHKEYKDGSIREETIDGINVNRSFIYVSKSKSVFKRLLNYFSFVISSYFRGRKLGNYDYLMVESPPLFLGISAILLSRKLKAKLIFNVSDLWPESAEILGIVKNKFLLSIAYRLETLCYKKAVLVTGQTMGIVRDIKKRFPNTNCYWLPNGVDPDFYNPENITELNFRNLNNFSKNNLLFFYGGIIGHAQALEVILLAAKQLEHRTELKFIIQGAGPELDNLLLLKDKLKLTNVLFLSPAIKKEMPQILKSVDIAFVHLKKLQLFKGAIPSKVFEALAMKKTLLLGVDGEAREHFITNAKAGYYFEPENVSELVSVICKIVDERDKLEVMGEQARDYVLKHFNRNKISLDFYEKLKQIKNI